MQGAIFFLAVLVWLAAVYGFIRIVMAWAGVARLAAPGSRFAAMLELSSSNFPAVRSMLGSAAEPYISGFRQGVKIFLLAFIPFILLVVVNIVTGNAA
jgi:hypothetical protein